MSEKALLNVVQEAYVHGVSTRKVDELVEALGMKGIDKSEVSRISKQLDEFVEELKTVDWKEISFTFGLMPLSQGSGRRQGMQYGTSYSSRS